MWDACKLLWSLFVALLQIAGATRSRELGPASADHRPAAHCAEEFQLLYGFLILQHDRRLLLCLETTAHPTAEWIARQLTEACGWDGAPRYLIRDRDRSYGEGFIRRGRAIGIREHPIAKRLCGAADRVVPAGMH
jgi:hypothetical protein